MAGTLHTAAEAANGVWSAIEMKCSFRNCAPDWFVYCIGMRACTIQSSAIPLCLLYCLSIVEFVIGFECHETEAVARISLRRVHFKWTEGICTEWLSLPQMLSHAALNQVSSSDHKYALNNESVSGLLARIGTIIHSSAQLFRRKDYRAYQWPVVASQHWVRKYCRWASWSARVVQR